MTLPVGLHFDTPNFGIGRRQICFERVKPEWGDAGALNLDGVVQFASNHDDACEIARQHERDFRGMVRTEELLSVWHDEFPEIDGYYILTDVELPTASPYAFHRLRLELSRVGSENDLRFESVLLGTVKDNDYSVDEAGSEPMHAPPLGHTEYEPRHTTTVTRNVAHEGDMTVYRDVDYDIDPRWSCAPRNFYRGACVIARRDPLYPQYGPIAGKSIYDLNVEDIEISNGLIRFHMTELAGATVEVWDGTAWRNMPLLLGAGGVLVPGFEHVTIRDNRPERCAIKYSHNEASGITGLEVSVVRGERGVRCKLTRDLSSTLSVASGVASTNTSNRLLRTAADANGHKELLVTMRTGIFTGASGTIEKVTATWMDFFV